MTPEMEKAEREKSREQIAEEVYQLDGEDLQEHLIDARMELQTLARASECHSLTEEEAGKITGEYSFLCGNPSRYVLDEKTVITLLMEHSNPSPVLEEVRKKIEDMLKTLATQERITNERIDTAASALEVDGIENELCRIEGQERALDIVLSIITELSKGKV